jgi:glycosyltransferase involved in cell wall biosynthesis
MGPATKPRLRVIGGPLPSGDALRPKLVIAHVLRNLDIGAPAQLALDLARSQRADGDGVLVVSLASAPSFRMAPDFRAAGIPVHILGRHARIDTTLPLRLALLLRKRRVDLVHTHDATALLVGVVAGRMAGATVVHSERGDGGLASWSAWAKVKATRLLDGVVSMSDRGARMAKAWGTGGHTLLRNVAQAVDLERFRPDTAIREQVRRQLGIQGDDWVIGTVGNLTKSKAHELLLRAAAPLLGKGTSLIVVGAGPEKASLRALAHQLGVADHVRWPGARRDVARMMAAMDTFALTSMDGDLPLVVSEAMAVGLPVVAPAMGSIPSVVVDGETGWVVPPGDMDALRSTLFEARQSEHQSRRMGARARRVAQTRFSLQRMHREYRRLYHSLVSGAAP